MCAKYYENPTMLSRVIAKNVGDVFFETHCRDAINKRKRALRKVSCLPTVVEKQKDPVTAEGIRLELAN